MATSYVLCRAGSVVVELEQELVQASRIKSNDGMSGAGPVLWW